jgi:hypothetical protein
MGFGEQLVAGIVTAVLLLGPIAFLVWVWRCTGSWARVARGGLLTVPAVSFVLDGGIAAVATAYEVFVWRAGPAGPDTESGDWEDVVDAFVTCGVYGVGFSWTGLMLAVPPFGLWYVVHRPSFTRVVAHHRAEPDSLLPSDDW